jgi:hypothetical protein
MDPLSVLDNYVITPSMQTAKGTSSGFSNILNNLTTWVVALTGIVTVFILIPLVPKAPANLIIVICVGALLLGIYLHVNQFGAEYRLSTWQNNLQFYASLIMLVLVMLLSMGFYYYQTDPGVRTAADGMFDRATSGVTSTTRGFTNYVSSGPSIGRH